MKITEKFKFIMLVAIATLFANNTNAQDSSTYDKGFRLGLGLTGGYAVHDPYKLALGADARLQYDLSKRYSLTLTTGYSRLFVSEADGDDLGFVPAKAGFKAFVWNDQFYIMGEAGAAFVTDPHYHNTSFLWAPSIGYATKYIDISLRYEQYENFMRTNNDGSLNKGVGQVGVRVAYGFDL
ncbi:hypothetical protein [Flavobacterium sp.]|uniref:hypothetical protein n=1 Tax=Flavobacterium sp. TaxID=239 RepID=UPI002BA3C432|nr:hypothetical protein [Flavobacterium sp.]HSD06286.1 hypothetical protein [Flavobacterium sp.]